MQITKIETIHLTDYPNILFVAVHTDEGLVGYADTFYMTDALRGYIHQYAAPLLLGRSPLEIELHWRRLYEMSAHIVGKGAEIRALSALDVALWDIFGQATGQPVWQLLGGAARPRIQTYNTCGGPAYGRGRKTAGDNLSHKAGAAPGRYEDLIAFMTDAGALAQDLLAEGIRGMKIWPFDYVAHTPGGFDNWRNFMNLVDPKWNNIGGHSISHRDLQAALEPFRQIRAAVGNEMEIMVEGQEDRPRPGGILPLLAGGSHARRRH
jgi:galactonate dehydratase